MRGIVEAVCFALLALQPAYAGKLKGGKWKGAGRRSLQVTTAKDGTPMPKQNTPVPKAAPTPSPKTTGPTPSPKTSTHKATEVAYDHYTWSSGDEALPNAHAIVSNSAHDQYEEKMKMSKMAEADGHHDEPKQKGVNNNENRPPRPVGASEDDYKGSGGGGNKQRSGGGSNKGAKSAQKTNKGGSSKISSSDDKGNKAGKKAGSGGDGASYDGASPDDLPEYKPPTGDKEYSMKGSKQSSKGGSKSKEDSKGDHTHGLLWPPGTTPQPPEPGAGYTPQEKPLTGVPLTRFSILYDIEDEAGVPMTSDFEDVHENTYLWLYTVLYQTYGEHMRNLLTDDTSNIYQETQPVLIEYASVVLFDQDHFDIPTTEELDQIVVDAFTGVNGESYLEGLQSLPESNPFSTTTSAELQNVPPLLGRSIVGSSLATRVSTTNMLPPLLSAAAFFVLLAGGAAVYKSRNSNQGLDGKGFDNLSRGDTAMIDDFTVTMSNTSEKSCRSRQTWDLALEVEPQKNLSPITEHHLDPDLAGWSDYFDASNGSKDSDRSSHEEHSQYSIEDFVNEAERNLLGVRIRYPGLDAHTGFQTREGQNETVCTALVPAPPSAIVPAPPSSLVPAALEDSDIVPHASTKVEL